MNDPNHIVTSSETSVHRIGRAWTLRDVETHAARSSDASRDDVFTETCALRSQLTRDEPEF